MTALFESVAPAILLGLLFHLLPVVLFSGAGKSTPAHSLGGRR